MYDQYLNLNPITTGTVLPKHKGIMVSVSSGTVGITFDFYRGTVTGQTFRSLLYFTAGTSVLPAQVYSVPNALASGSTAFYLT